MKVPVDTQIAILGLPKPEPEYKFALELGRHWRFDWAWPEPGPKVALELDGGTHIRGGGGRHNRPGGFEEDLEKLNAAALLGWTTYRVTTKMAEDGRLAALLLQIKEKYFSDGDADDADCSEG